MSYPPEKKLYIGNIKNLDIKVLMNTVRLIDPYAYFNPDANKNFGFIHVTTPEKCNEIFEKLLNSMYNGRHIIVERPKSYIDQKIVKPPITVTPIYGMSESNSVAWGGKKINPENEFRTKMIARQMAINEAERVKAIVESERTKADQIEADRVAYDIEIAKMLKDAADEDAFVDSLFAIPPKRVILNPEEECY